MTLVRSRLSAVSRLALALAFVALLGVQAAAAAPLDGSVTDSAAAPDAQVNHRISLSDLLVSSY
jgi:hypothetical protein